MFNIGGQGQYLVGLFAVASTSATHLAGLPARPAHRPRHRRRDRSSGLVWGGIAGLPEGERRRPRGDHDDHAQLDRDLRRPVALRARRPAAGRRAVAARSDASLDVGQAPDVRDRAPAAPRRHLHRARRAGRLLRCSSTGRRSASRSAPSASTPRRRATAASRSARNYFLALAIAGGVRRASRGALDMLGWKFHVATNDIDVSAVGFVGIAVALLGRNTAIGIFFSALLFAALQTGTSPRQIDSERLPARARRQPLDDDPGADHPVRRRPSS